MFIITNCNILAYIDKCGKLSEADARRFFWQIISATEYCHNRRVVHRDLKVCSCIKYCVWLHIIFSKV